MKVYVDLIILINALYDFLILSSVSILLKRNAHPTRIILGTLIGMSTIVTLFIRIDKIFLLLLKLLISIMMVISTFGKDKLFENIFYFYIITIIIGGSQYLINGNEYEVNIITKAIISPIIIALYIKSFREYKIKCESIHDVIIIDGDNTIKLNGFMDTGNTLIDPITKYPVIMINKNIKIYSNKVFYVPYVALNHSSILKCIKVDKVLINNKLVNVLLGISDDLIFNKEYDVVLNNNIREIII